MLRESMARNELIHASGFRLLTGVTGIAISCTRVNIGRGRSRQKIVASWFQQHYLSWHDHREQLCITEITQFESFSTNLLPCRHSPDVILWLTGLKAPTKQLTNHVRTNANYGVTNYLQVSGWRDTAENRVLVMAGLATYRLKYDPSKLAFLWNGV